MADQDNQIHQGVEVDPSTGEIPRREISEEEARRVHEEHEEALARAAEVGVRALSGWCQSRYPRG